MKFQGSSFQFQVLESRTIWHEYARMRMKAHEVATVFVVFEWGWGF
jgi:hypothetical protein